MVFVSERRIWEFAPWPGEKNNNDCGYNRFCTAMACCALTWWDGGVNFFQGKGNKTYKAKILIYDTVKHLCCSFKNLSLQ